MCGRASGQIGGLWERLECLGAEGSFTDGFFIRVHSGLAAWTMPVVSQRPLFVVDPDACKAHTGTPLLNLTCALRSHGSVLLP